MLGDILKHLRINRGLSRKDIEQQLGITERNIKSYELDTSKPPIDVLIKLADFYEVSVDYLLGRDDKKFVEDVSKMSDNDLDKKLMQFFMDLPESSKQGIRDFMMSVVNGLSVTQESPPIVTTTPPSEEQGEPMLMAGRRTDGGITKQRKITQKQWEELENGEDVDLN